MNNKTKFQLLLFLLMVFLSNASVLFAHITASDPGFSISSDFGPRVILQNGSLKYDFHKAIDYSGVQ